MANIPQRINEIVNKEGISIRKMEQLIGASNGVISRAIQKNTDISSIWVSKIIEAYPKYDAKWLITGKGKMILEEESEQRIEENKPPDGHEIYAKVLLERIEELTLQVNELNKELEEIKSKSHYKYMNIAEEQEKYNSPKKE